MASCLKRECLNYRRARPACGLLGLSSIFELEEHFLIVCLMVPCDWQPRWFCVTERASTLGSVDDDRERLTMNTSVLKRSWPRFKENFTLASERCKTWDFSSHLIMKITLGSYPWCLHSSCICPSVLSLSHSEAAAHAVATLAEATLQGGGQIVLSGETAAAVGALTGVQDANGKRS